MNRPPLTDEDGEVRELVLDDFKTMRPLAETDPGIAQAMKAMREGGRTKVGAAKVHAGFRLAADVVEGIKATGKGYSARVERVLREALAAGKLDASRDVPDQ